MLRGLTDHILELNIDILSLEVLSGELQYIPVFHTSCSDVKSAVSSTPGIDNTTICLGLVEKAGITLCLKWRYL